jgi:transcriptional regulator with XRE-family HTH domain
MTIAGMAKPSPTHSGDKILTSLGAAIRRARALKGLSQEQLAVDSGLDRSYFGGIERGEHNLTVVSLQKIADALNVKMSALLSEARL